MLNALKEYINNYWQGVSGLTVTGAYTTTVHTSNYLVTHKFGPLSLAEWMQVGGFIYVMVLLSLAVIKLVGKINGKDNG